MSYRGKKTFHRHGSGIMLFLKTINGIVNQTELNHFDCIIVNKTTTLWTNLLKNQQKMSTICVCICSYYYLLWNKDKSINLKKCSRPFCPSLAVLWIFIFSSILPNVCYLLSTGKLWTPLICRRDADKAHLLNTLNAHTKCARFHALFGVIWIRRRQ